MKELRALGNEEIIKKLEELRAEIRREKASVLIGTRPENPGRIRKMRRDVARILTILKERGVELEAY